MMTWPVGLAACWFSSLLSNDVRTHSMALGPQPFHLPLSGVHLYMEGSGNQTSNSLVIHYHKVIIVDFYFVTALQGNDMHLLAITEVSQILLSFGR